MTATRIDQDMATLAAGMLPDEVTSKLRHRYRQVRVMLHSAGLAATYAFLASKSNNGDAGADALSIAYGKVARGIKQRLADLDILPGDPAGASHKDVLAALGKADAAHYARANADVDALAGWLARLADAMYQSPKEPVE